MEEKYVLPILGKENELIKKALTEHESIKRLFESNTEIQKDITLIEEELEYSFKRTHLFGGIQKFATVEQLQSIEINHSDEKFVDNLTDPFWE